MKYSLIAIALFSSYIGQLFAAEDETPKQFVHASFVDGKRSMRNLVDFPKTNSDVEVAVICTAHATAKGRLDDARCSAADDPDLDFTMAVSRRFGAARLNPASVDGKAEEVDFQFTVLFQKTGDAESVSVYLHNMKNVDRLGLDYIGAQRYSIHPWPNECGSKTANDLVIEIAVVDMTGRAKETDVVTAKFPMTPMCEAGFDRYLGKSTWIPALYDGNFVDAVWTQPRAATLGTFKRRQNPFKE